MLNRLRTLGKVEATTSDSGPVNLSALSSSNTNTTANTRPARPTLIKSDAITIVALYVGDIPLMSSDASRARNLVPLNMEALAQVPAVQVTTSDDDKVPLYRRATAHGDAIMFEVKAVQGEATGESKKKPISFVKIDPTHEAAQATLGNNTLFTVSEWIKGQSALQQLAPYTFVTVYNVTFRYWESKKSDSKGLSFNVDRIDATPWAALNALSVERRLEIAFPSYRQTMPHVRDWMLLSDLTKAAFVRNAGVVAANDDATEERKHKAAFMRRLLGNLLPVALFAANRPYELDVFRSENELDAETGGPLRFIIPPLGLTAAAAASSSESTNEFESVVLNVDKHIYKHNEKEGKHSLALEADFACLVYDQGVVTHRQYFARCTVFASSFESLGIYYPAWIEQAFDLHPIPFLTLMGVNVQETINDPTNETLESTPGEAYKQGHIVGQVASAHFEMGRYLQRHGIPCTRSLIKARYGGENGDAEPTIAKEYKDSRIGAFKADAVINPARSVDLLARDGLVAFDTEVSRKLLPESHPNVKYYALNLITLTEALPREARAASGCDADLLCDAVTLTPEQGDAYILRTFGKKAPQNTSKGDDWLQKKPAGMPSFLFFAVRVDEAPAAAAPPSTAITNLVTSIFAPAAKLDPAEAAKLPANLNALRRQIIERLAHPAGVKSDPMDITPAAPAPASPSVKRERDDDVDEDEEARESKRARIDPIPQPSSLMDDDEDEWAD